VTAPLNEGAALQLSTGDGVAADGAQDTRVSQLGRGGDDAVGDVVVDGLSLIVSHHEPPQLSHINSWYETHAVLLLLHLNSTTVLEGPLDDIGVLADALDELGRLEGRPEVGKVLELDMVPDMREGSLDDSALQHRGGGWDLRSGHGDGVLWCVSAWDESSVVVDVFCVDSYSEK
jgi:hypothetical protein